MARTKKKGSKIPFDGLRLDKDEETNLKNKLRETGLTMAYVKRMLVRKWLAGEVSVL